MKINLDKKQLISALDFLSFWPLALTFFLIPLFFTGATLAGAGFDKAMLFYFLTCFAFLAWFSKGILIKKLEIKTSKIDFLVLFLLFIFSLSAIFSESRFESFFGSFGLPEKSLLFLFVFIVFYFLFKGCASLKRLIQALALIAASNILLSFYFLFHIFGVFSFLGMSFLNFNIFGSFADFAIFFSAPLSLLAAAAGGAGELKFKTKLRKTFLNIFIWSAIALNVLALAVLGSFVFWPAVLLGVVILLTFSFSGIIRAGRQTILSWIGVLAVLIVLFIASGLNLFDFRLPEEIVLSRQASWNITKEAVMANPLLGSGPSTFRRDFLQFRDISFNSSPSWNITFNSANGIIFEVLATTGLAGALAVLLLILGIIFFTFRSLPEISRGGLLVAGALASFIVFIFLSFISSLGSVSIIYFVLLGTFLISAFSILSEKERVLFLSLEPGKKIAPRVFGFIFLGNLILIVALVYGLKIFTADVYAYKSQSATEINAKIEGMGKAIKLAPLQSFYFSSQAKNYLEAAVAENSEGNTDGVTANMQAAAVNIEKALALNNSSENNELAAVIYESSFFLPDALSRAEKYYKEAIELNPNDPVPYIRLGMLNSSKFNSAQSEGERETAFNEAIKAYNQAITRKNDLSEVYYLKAMTYGQKNDLDNVIIELGNAIRYNDFPDYKNALGRAYMSRAMENENSGHDLEKAEKIYLELNALAPNNLEINYNLALIYKNLDNKENLNKVVDKMLELVESEEEREMIKKEFLGKK